MLKRLVTRVRQIVRNLALKMNRAYADFIRDGGDDLLTKGLDLPPGSWVVDFGGYLGDWSWEIHSNYQVNLVIVEPVPKFVEKLHTRFEGKAEVKIEPFIVGRSSTSRKLYLSDDATGSRALGIEVVVQERPIDDFISCLEGNQVQLACINIEGGEYDLIELMTEREYLNIFNIIFVQFHRNQENVGRRYVQAQKMLSRTHELTWDYPFIWQRWDRRSSTYGNTFRNS